MEIQQSWRLKLTYKNATIIFTILNVVTAIFLLQVYLSPTNSRTMLSSGPHHALSVDLKYIRKSEEIRLAMQPLELIKRVREIERENNSDPGMVQKKEAKQTAAVDLSKRLQDLHAINDAANSKALEEWQRRKMERARQRELKKKGTVYA